MAHKILGVDLGAHSLKLARLEAGFRKASLLGVAIEPAAHAESTSASVDVIAQLGRLLPQLRRVKAFIAEHKEPIEEVALGLPGDQVTFRVVDLPFSDPRKIESVLGYELESQVLMSIDELVIDHVVIGPHGAETRVMCAAAPKALIDGLVKAATELELPLRVVAAAPLAYATMVPPDPPATGAEATPGARTTVPSLVIDIGHEHTTLCVVRDGKPELARSVPRAGRHFTDAIAATFRLDAAAAEQAKHEAGFIAHSGLAPESAGQHKMDECLREAVKPLLRELKQTLASYRASSGEPVTKLWITGGGSRLVGLGEHLGESLGLPSAPLPWPEHEGWSEIAADAPDRVAIAVGVGQTSAAGGPQVNFRKGEFSYRTDYSFMRGKALSLASSLLVMLAFAALNAFASLRGLRREQDTLSQRLKRESMEVFNAELDPRAISDELKGGQKGSGPPPIPTVTAFDLLDEISRRVPPNDKIKLDILELDIKPKKTFIKATAETAQQVDDLADALAKIDCFEDVQKGKLSTVSAPVPPPSDTAKADNGGKTDSGKSDSGKPAEKEKGDYKQFTLTITTTCP